MRKLTPDDFWRRVIKTTTCWLWEGPQTHGYGKWGRSWQAHRWSWVEANGAIPDGLFVLHSCDTPLCVRPSHLFLGTQADNVLDMHSKGRWSSKNPAKGSRNAFAKLTETTVADVKRRRRQGETIPAIARSINVSRYTVEDIVYGRSWRHVA